MRASGSRRAWGWHPLTDEWAARIVAQAGVRPGDLVIDIGAGRGALTAALVAAGARVLAVELHPGRAAFLRERFGDGGRPARWREAGGSAVSVVHADALSLRLPRRPFRVVASPPYAITSALLRLLLASGSGLLTADLVLQRAAVRRFVGGDVRLPRRWELRPGPALPRHAFRPPPQTDSAVLLVRRR